MCYIILMETLDEQLDKAIAENSALQAENSALQAEMSKLESVNECMRAEIKRARYNAAKHNSLSRASIRTVVKGGKVATPLSSVVDRFQAITNPTKQTQFLRSLAPHERAELFLNL